MDAVRVLQAMRAVSNDEGLSLSVPTSDLAYRTSAGALAVKWDTERAKALFKALKDDEPLTEPPAGTGDQSDGSPGATGGGGQAFLEIREATSGSVRLNWSAAAADADYEVSVDGEPVATTRATRARLIGLKPDAKYLVEVRNRKLGYRAKGSAETAPAASPVQNSWFVLTNSLTGGAADLYAARSADGTPVTLGNDEGGTQQQWQLVPAGDDTYSLVSKASNRCAVPLGGRAVAGSPLVQGDCRSGQAATWTLRASAYGFTIRAASGDLVIGVGAQRFGTQRVLVLQEDTEQRHQSWTAVPD
jgi:hypothetical protein